MHMNLFLTRTEICDWILSGPSTTSKCLNGWDDSWLVSSHAAAVEQGKRQHSVQGAAWELWVKVPCLLLTDSCCSCFYTGDMLALWASRKFFFKTLLQGRATGLPTDAALANSSALLILNWNCLVHNHPSECLTAMVDSPGFSPWTPQIATHRRVPHEPSLDLYLFLLEVWSRGSVETSYLLRHLEAVKLLLLRFPVCQGPQAQDTDMVH